MLLLPFSVPQEGLPWSALVLRKFGLGQFQFHTEWSHFSTLIVSIDYDGVSTKLMTILMIVLSIWVILACPNFYHFLTAGGYYRK